MTRRTHDVTIKVPEALWRAAEKRHPHAKNVAQMLARAAVRRLNAEYLPEYPPPADVEQPPLPVVPAGPAPGAPPAPDPWQPAPDPWQPAPDPWQPAPDPWAERVVEPIVRAVRSSWRKSAPTHCSNCRAEILQGDPIVEVKQWFTAEQRYSWRYVCAQPRCGLALWNATPVEGRYPPGPYPRVTRR